MYKPLPDGVTIRESDIEGLGLFAEKFIPKGTYLGIIHIPDNSGSGEYIRTPLGGFGNHSETPNCDKSTTDDYKGNWAISTNRDIQPDEEITWTYTFYEVEYTHK